MSNVNLTRVFENGRNHRSMVDSTQRLSTNVDGNAVYADLRLDLGLTDIVDRPLNARQSKVDLATNVNEEAVIKALQNILSTSKNMRLLYPEMDVNVNGFLFEPLTESKAFFISYHLSKMIPLYEPRVKVSSISVNVNYDDSSYLINMEIAIPSLNKTIHLKHVFSVNSFSMDI